MGLERSSSSTRLKHLLHQGPLRIQRPFYPAGTDGSCHLYLLHPPGGMVTGDTLSIHLDMKTACQSLVTTPSAGKIYRGDQSELPQRQLTQLNLHAEAELEWLPQETIVFDGARGELHTDIQLESSSRLACWDIVCLGRPASNEAFEQGYLTQSLHVRIGTQTRYRERNHFQGSSPLLNAPWGMNGATVSGTMLITAKPNDSQLEQLRAIAQATQGTGICALSAIEDLLLLRYLGASAERCKSCFEAIWKEIRSELWDTPYIRPRIWNT